MITKIKYFFIETTSGRQIIYVSIIILIGISLFLVGRLSKNNLNPGIEIEYPRIEIEQKTTATDFTDPKSEDGEVRGNYFASKKGKKYYPVGCASGKSIKLENRIYFQTPKDAENKGYTKSISCR